VCEGGLEGVASKRTKNGRSFRYIRPYRSFGFATVRRDSRTFRRRGSLRAAYGLVDSGRQTLFALSFDQSVIDINRLSFFQRQFEGPVVYIINSSSFDGKIKVVYFVTIYVISMDVDWPNNIPWNPSRTVARLGILGTCVRNNRN